MVSRQQAETALARVLLERIRNDAYPSTTQMTMLEQVIPASLVQEYMNVLLTKVSQDQWPSTPMLARIRRVAQALPA
jgi:hypothetical protein